MWMVLWLGCSGEFGCEAKEWLVDRDGDGYGTPVLACEPFWPVVQLDGDCNDDDEEQHPDASERCDEQDNDCDGAVDEPEDLGPGQRVFRDVDGDGWGAD